MANDFFDDDFFDVELPDGTIIENVPKGTTKAQLISKLSKNGYDVSGLTRTQQPVTQDTAPSRPKTSRFKALADTFAQGATLGFGDELSAGLATALSYPTYAAMGIDEDKTLGERYRSFLGAQREDIKRAREDYPVQSLATELTGAIGTGGGLAKGAAKLAPKAAAAAKGYAVANPLKTAAMTSGATGGAYGFGTGEGGLAERAKQAGVSAAISAPLGVVGSKVTQKISSKLAQAPKPIVKESDELIGSERLRQQASKLYDIAAKKGGKLKEDKTRMLLDKIEKDVSPSGVVEEELRLDPGIKQSIANIRKKLTGGKELKKNIDELLTAKQQTLDLGERIALTNKIERLQKQLKNTSDGATYNDLRALEATLGQRAESSVIGATGKLDATGKMLKQAQHTVRDFLDNVADKDVIGGKTAFALKRKADQKWKQSLKLNEIEKIANRASGQRQPSTGLISGFNTMLANPKRMRGFDKKEIELMKKAAEQDLISGGLRNVGSRFTPMMGGYSGLAHYGFLDPIGYAITGGAYALSLAARKAANARQMAKVNALRKLIEEGGDAVKQAPINPALIFKPAYTSGVLTGRSQGE